jgi:tRNA threonylcarbamoyladenosine biosynthesis protein TsaE
METKYTINNLEELSLFATDLLELARAQKTDSAVVISLSGDLGAGKTTLVQTLAKQLGVKEVVTSPTFTIMKGYQTEDESFKDLVHIDAYRIDDIDEVRPLGLSVILQKPQTLVCIEWAERISTVLPPGTIFITIDNLELEKRLITVTN